jgi:SRSO17 transposase
MAKGPQASSTWVFAVGLSILTQRGLNHYEVRSWTGWQHHMTLTLLALWFLQIERLRLGGQKIHR